METIEAKIEERGNGFPSAGDYVASTDDLYRIVEMWGRTETTGLRGNWRRAKVELVDWSECAESDQFPAQVVIGEF